MVIKQVNLETVCGITSVLPKNQKPEVAFACGSKSHSSTFAPRACSAAVRLTAVVVLPTPPF